MSESNHNIKKPKKIDVLVIPQGASKVFNFDLTSRALKYFKVGAVLFLVFTGLVLFKFFNDIKNLNEFHTSLLTSEHYDLKLKKIFQDLGRQRETLNSLSQMDEKLRVILGLDEYGNLDENVSTNYFESNTQLIKDSAVANFNFVLNDIPRYHEENRMILSLRESSLEELQTYVFEQQNNLLYTPSIKPVKVGYLTSGYGLRTDPFFGVQRMHYGIDWAFLPHTPIYATAYGTVKRVYYSLSYGNVVVIDHKNGIETFYAHLASSNVKIGQKVRRGQIIARMGNTGKRSTGTHLHYEVLLNGKPVPPDNYILEDLPEARTEFIVEF